MPFASFVSFNIFLSSSTLVRVSRPAQEDSSWAFLFLSLRCSSSFILSDINSMADNIFFCKKNQELSEAKQKIEFCTVIISHKPINIRQHKKILKRLQWKRMNAKDLNKTLNSSQREELWQLGNLDSHTRLYVNYDIK